MSLWGDYPEFNKYMTIVETEILNTIKSRQPLIKKATIALLEAGGKRLRPALVLLAHNFGNEENPNIHKLAAAVEVFHMATLVHDDIIDDSKIRRGVKTTQAKWGKRVAVFTGDYLLSKAFINLSKHSTNKDIISASFIAKNICEGEIEQFDSRYRVDLSLKKYLWRIKCKTAYLFSFSCWFGATEGKADKEIANTLKKYGHYLGMAFQISDDILDFIGNENKLGKPLGNDIKNGIYTLPVIYTLKYGGSSEKLKELLLKDRLNQEELSFILRSVIEEGGLSYANKILKKYVNKAKSELGKLPVQDSLPLMYKLAEDIVHREY